MKRVNFFLTYWETGSMKHFGIFCLIFFRHMVAAAQTGYTGKVADGQNKQPLEAVAVSLLAADSTIMSYSYTDSNGHFEIINRGTRTAEFLSFTYMGYRRVLLPARSFKNGTTVELEETTYKIKEVKITRSTDQERERYHHLYRERIQNATGQNHRRRTEENSRH